MSDDDKDIVEEEVDASDDAAADDAAPVADDVKEEVADEKPAAKPAGDSSDGNKLYVGNLPFGLDNAKLGDLFSGIDGVEVVEAVVITDKFNEGRSKGFGFVTVADAAQAEKAIEAVNGSDVDGRKIVVNVARPRVDRADRGGDRNSFRRSY